MISSQPAMSPKRVRSDYGLDGSVFERHAGGFDSDCWVLDGTWFVKLWRRGPLEHLDLLERLRGSGLPVVAPLRTRSGELSSMWAGRPYAVFPYVTGRTAGDDDWAETARPLKRVHEVADVAVPRTTMQKRCIDDLRARLDHPWIRHRRRDVASQVDRLEDVIARVRSIEVPHVLFHSDFGGFNLLLDDDGVAAILDWDQACLAPREHDVWIAAEGPRGGEFLEEYGAADFDLTHIEYALLARALRDMAARVCGEVDRPGVHTWGFARLARLEPDLEMFRRFCHAGRPGIPRKAFGKLDS